MVQLQVLFHLLNIHNLKREQQAQKREIELLSYKQ